MSSPSWLTLAISQEDGLATSKLGIGMLPAKMLPKFLYLIQIQCSHPV
jgi:hypothetical protein